MPSGGRGGTTLRAPGGKAGGKLPEAPRPTVSKAPGASRHQRLHAHLLPLLLSFIVGGGISTVSQLANFKAQHQTDTFVSVISPRALDGPAHPLDGSQKWWAGHPFGGGWVVTERRPHGRRRQQERCSSSTAGSRQVALSGPRSPRPSHEGLNTEPRFRAPSACYLPAVGEPRRRGPPSRGGQRHPEALCGGRRPAHLHSTCSGAREQVLGQQHFLAPGHEQARRPVTEAGCDLNVLFKDILTQMEAATMKWGHRSSLLQQTTGGRVLHSSCVSKARAWGTLTSAPPARQRSRSRAHWVRITHAAPGLPQGSYAGPGLRCSERTHTASAAQPQGFGAQEAEARTGGAGSCAPAERAQKLVSTGGDGLPESSRMQLPNGGPGEEGSGRQEPAGRAEWRRALGCPSRPIQPLLSSQRQPVRTSLPQNHKPYLNKHLQTGEGWKAFCFDFIIFPKIAFLSGTSFCHEPVQLPPWWDNVIILVTRLRF